MNRSGIRSGILMAAIAATLGCVKYVVVQDVPAITPPLVAPTTAREPLSPAPTSDKFRVLVMDVYDQTGLARELSGVLADKITTALQKTTRFDIIDRNQTRGWSQKEVNSIVDDTRFWLDAVIAPSITSVSPKSNEIVVDVKVTNAKSLVVIDAFTISLKVQSEADLTVDNVGIQNLAQFLATSIPQPKNAHIQSVDGDQIMIEAGVQDGIKKGMTFFVLAEGDTPKKDRNAEDTGSASQYIIGDYFVTSVEPTRSRALRRWSSQRSQVWPGDLVRFK